MRRIITRKIPRPGSAARVRLHKSTASKLAALLVLTLVVSVVNVLFFSSVLHDFRDMASTVNTAGKLRLLSQKIELDTAGYIANPERGSAAVMNGVAEFDAVINALSHGGVIFGSEIRPVADRNRMALDEVRAHWEDYRNQVTLAMRAMQADGHAPQARAEPADLRYQLSLQATRLLHASEGLVDAIVKDMQQRQQHARTWMYANLAAVFLCFAGALWYVRRRIGRPLDLLAKGMRRLSDGDYHLHVQYPVNDDMGGLVRSLNHSARHFGTLLHELEHSHASLTRAEAMFRGVVEHSGIGVYVWSGRRFLFVNPEMASLLGYERDVMIRELEPGDVFFDDVIADDDRSQITLHDNGSPRTKRRQRGRRRDGSIIDLEVFESVMTFEGETVTLCVAVDVTTRRKDESVTRLARLVYEVSSEAMVITSPDARIIHVNPAFTRITGYEARDVVGARMNVLSSGKQGREFYRTMWESIERDGSWEGEIWNRRKNGDMYAQRLSINTSFDDSGTPVYRVGLFSDITARKKAEELIWRQAYLDGLTNLPNRQMLLDKLGNALRRARVQGLGVALAQLDIDQFKYVNDSLGHNVGDELLKQVAARIKDCLRDGDSVGRLGGDEFMIIITDTRDPITADRVCRRVIEAMSAPFHIGDDVISLTVTLGMTVFPQDGDSALELFKNVDIAMYEAKMKGRNQYCWFRASMRDKIAARRRLGRELSQAIEYEQFSLVYQPIVDLATGEVCKAEALIRWNHPERGVVGPAEFIPFAEDSGVIDVIGDWVFNKAAQQVAIWQEQFRPDFQVNINVSPVQFQAEASGITRWFQKLRELRVEGNSLIVEITEGLLMDVNTTVSRRLQSFQKSGIEVALDDFGTGYSSLSYLKKLDIDYVKIDRTFVSSLGPDPDAAVLCEAIVVMAHRLGLKVIAEGIETAEQRRLLIEAGCDFGQGYYFGRPVSAARFCAYVSGGAT